MNSQSTSSKHGQPGELAGTQVLVSALTLSLLGLTNETQSCSMQLLLLTDGLRNAPLMFYW